MSKKVLIAESDNAVQQVVSYFLNLEGFDVLTAGDGVMALEMTEKVSPEVILLDMNLSGINGIEVSRLIQDKSEYKNIPILFLADEKAGESVPSGFGVINKPIDPVRLVNTIKEYSDRVQQDFPKVPESNEDAFNETVDNEAISSEVINSDVMNIEELLGWEVSKETAKEKASDDISSSVDEVIQSVYTEQQTSGPNIDDLDGQDQEVAMDAAAEEESAAPSEENEERFESGLRDRITEDMIENMLRKIAGEIMERVAGEIVPKIAEEEIRKEIERIKSEGE